jgi:hypothetical protein
MGIIDRLKSNRTKMFEQTKTASTRTKFVSPFYAPLVNSDKCASVVFRFLPSLDPEKLPYIQIFQHFFKGDTNEWVSVDVCPSTVERPCPICECNTRLWNSNNPEFQEIAKSRFKRKKYISNIYIIKDPLNPEKEGQVLPFMFGPEIFGILADVISPKFEDDDAIDPFDLWAGADFNMRVTWQPEKGMPTYKNSKFINIGKAFLGGKEDKYEDILSKAESLDKWIAPDRFQSYETLMKKCQSAYFHTLDIATPGFDSEKATRQDVPEKKVQKPEKKKEKISVVEDVKETRTLGLSENSEVEDDDEDELEYLRKIAAD